MYNLVAGDIMVIDLIKLLSGNSSIPFSFDYSFSEKELENSGILELNNVIVVGIISKDALGNLVMDANIKAKAVVPCAISLVKTDVFIDVSINDEIANLMENYQNNAKTLDILPIIWENILVEIPSKVVNPASKLETSGDGWQVITEEKDKINPELAKLKDLL